MSLSPREAAEKKARYRFFIMSFARVGGLALLLIGVAITRGAVPLSPQWIFGAVLAVLGLLEFFFLPPIIAKRWKAAERAGAGRRR